MTITSESTNREFAHWRPVRDNEGIVWLRIDKSDGSVNVLSRPVLEELAEAIAPYENDPPRGLVIHSGKQNGFVMGADINEFTKIGSPEDGYRLIRLGQQVLDRVASLRCPTVAAIDGYALGGGLELALACDYRIALQNSKAILGLPEVQLGIHPGFGGTVRAVRLCGVRAAMDLMLTGKSVTPSKAIRIKLVDRIVAPDNWKQAAREIIAAERPTAKPPLMDRLLNLLPARPFVARTLRRQVDAHARPDHYPAPYAIIHLWRRHGASERSGFEAEARSMAELMCGSTSRNLVRVFFLQNRLKSQGGKPETRVAKLHVIGAGVMGGDIAAWCALRGLEVTLQDRAEEYLRPALERAGRLFSRKLRNEREREQAAGRLRADVAGEGIRGAKLVIEAIFENLEAKQQLYSDVQAKMAPHAVLATNTSSIRLEELRTALDQPRRFIGLHFFNPVAKLPLVEVIRCDDTEQAVLDLAFAFVRDIGKYPLECASSPGFVVNRVLAPYLAQALELADAGVPLTEIDRAAEDFGMPAGPIELVDTVGLDIALNVSEVLGTALGRPLPPRLKEMVEKSQLGRKSGQGFYRWDNGKPVKPETPKEARSRVPGDITDRLILPMVNESVACLSENVVADADLLDAGVVFGIGFAPFRGGPLKYARDRGVAEIRATLEALEEKHGEWFTPHDGWSRFAQDDAERKK